jgi:predicted CopG family antitoxin
MAEKILLPLLAHQCSSLLLSKSQEKITLASARRLYASLHLDDMMSRRTTVVLDEDVYQALVEESMKKYGTPRSVSKVINEELRGAIRGRRKISLLLRSKRIARVSSKDFEEFRSQLSKVAESR